jgi:hypothetical protein
MVHRFSGPVGSIEDSETRLQLDAEHRMMTDTSRTIFLCIMTGPTGCDHSLLTSLFALVYTVASKEENGRMR